MKFYGKIGFWDETSDSEITDDVWRPNIVEKTYRGDVLKNFQKIQSSEFQNDNIALSNKIKIVADMYMTNSIDSIKYVEWKGTKWKVNSIEIDYPSVILEIGGVYNGETPRSGDDV